MQRQPDETASAQEPTRLVEGVNGWSQGWSRTFVCLCALAIGICYADRANMADAIIPMSEEMGWSRSVEGTILSSFFLGYGATQILGGSLADKVGGKRVLTAAVLLWSLATLLTPTFARQGVGALIGSGFAKMCRPFAIRYLPRALLSPKSCKQDYDGRWRGARLPCYPLDDFAGGSA